MGDARHQTQRLAAARVVLLDLLLVFTSDLYGPGWPVMRNLNDDVANPGCPTRLPAAGGQIENQNESDWYRNFVLRSHQS